MAIADDEDDAWLYESPPRPVRSRKRPASRKEKTFDLDDLLADAIKEKNAKLKSLAKVSSTSSSDSLDDESEDEDIARKEKELLNIIEPLEIQLEVAPKWMNVNGMPKEGIKWGQKIFGAQREFPALDFDYDPDGLFGRAASAMESLSTSSIHGLQLISRGELALELLTGNWLLPFAKITDQISGSALHSVFNAMAYSKDEAVQAAACRMLCDLLNSTSQRGGIWLPAKDFILQVLENYGYLDVPMYGAEGDGTDGPPENIVFLLQFLCHCCRNQQWRGMLSAADAEDLTYKLARGFLDRKAVPYASNLKSCVESLIDYFLEDEWQSHCKELANRFCSSSIELVDHMRLLRCLSGVGMRMKFLRIEYSFSLLCSLLRIAVESPSIQDVISAFDKIDTKRGAPTDFVDLYHEIELANICLLANPSPDTVALKSWLAFLQRLSLRIDIVDARTFATKVRNRAAYLWHTYSRLNEMSTEDAC